MFKTALNKNIIRHTWKLANIVPIPKPNKDTDKGTSHRPISLPSVIAKTLEKNLRPYITANIPNTPMQHGYKTQHSTVTALHTLNNTVAKGFNQMDLPARTITNTSTSAAKKYIQPYLHTVFAWTKQNHFILNPYKTTCTLFTPNPAEYTSILHPKVLGLTLDPKLTYRHTSTTSQYTHKHLQIMKAHTATGWGNQKGTLMVIYQAVMRPALEYASSIWLPLASSTSLTNNKSYRTQH